MCIGQPMFLAGDLNACPAVIPSLAKGTSAGLYDSALAYSLCAGVASDVAVMLLIDGSLLIFCSLSY